MLAWLCGGQTQARARWHADDGSIDLPPTSSAMDDRAARPRTVADAIPGAEDDGGMASERLAEIGLDAALRALEAQERAVEQLRSRTGMLLTASSLVASFFGGGAIRYGRAVGPPVAFALTVLIASILLCVYILVPKHELTFTLDAEDAYERLVGHDDAEINRHILVWLTAFARENQVELAGLDRAYLLAAICLVLQLCAWSIPLFASIR